MCPAIMLVLAVPQMCTRNVTSLSVSSSSEWSASILVSSSYVKYGYIGDAVNAAMPSNILVFGINAINDASVLNAAAMVGLAL